MCFLCSCQRIGFLHLRKFRFLPFWRTSSSQEQTRNKPGTRSLCTVILYLGPESNQEQTRNKPGNENHMFGRSAPCARGAPPACDAVPMSNHLLRGRCSGQRKVRTRSKRQTRRIFPGRTALGATAWRARAGQIHFAALQCEADSAPESRAGSDSALESRAGSGFQRNRLSGQGASPSRRPWSQREPSLRRR